MLTHASLTPVINASRTASTDELVHQVWSSHFDPVLSYRIEKYDDYASASERPFHPLSMTIIFLLSTHTTTAYSMKVLRNKDMGYWTSFCHCFLTFRLDIKVTDRVCDNHEPWRCPCLVPKGLLEVWEGLTWHCSGANVYRSCLPGPLADLGDIRGSNIIKSPYRYL